MTRRVVVSALAIVTFVLAFLLFSPFVLEETPVDSSRQFNEDVRVILQMLHQGYVDPVRAASDETTDSCRYVKPGSENQDCERFVSLIEMTNPLLETYSAQLRSLVDRARSDVPESLSTQLTQLADLLEAAHAANRLLVTGWELGDEESWSKSWRLRDALGDLSLPAPSPG